ncbi:putative disease resistance protein RGA1 [Lolium rigidum]|uniref:putative disease resistance protein RGA1 n=1 Tax=Lolium rigidum TaxID=89674 RepID=UPI001F5DC2D8|nr:putative disease resistance protein RGA1 [Lolium rigidum]
MVEGTIMDLMMIKMDGANDMDIEKTTNNEQQGNVNSQKGTVKKINNAKGVVGHQVQHQFEAPILFASLNTVLLRKGIHANNILPGHIMEHYSSSLLNSDENCNFIDTNLILHGHAEKDREGASFQADPAPGSVKIRSAVAPGLERAGAAGPALPLGSQGTARVTQVVAVPSPGNGKSKPSLASLSDEDILVKIRLTECPSLTKIAHIVHDFSLASQIISILEIDSTPIISRHVSTHPTQFRTTSLKVVGAQIGSAIGGQITLQKNFDEDLKKMKMALESVDAVLEDAERRSITDKSTRLWLKRLKDLMYVVSDMIDEFEADTQPITQPSPRKCSFKKYLAIMIPCLTIGPKITVANRMEKMREDLEEITYQRKKFKLTEGTNASEPKLTDIRETSSIMETQIVGRTDDKNDILASLSESMTQDITILPIYGIGGLGKTTLAKMVYNSFQFKEYSQGWVYVSQTFDLKNIGNSIITQLSEKEKESEYTEIQMIHKSLQKLFAGKKILIVLDDLWEGEDFHLEGLTDMLKVGKDNSVVVIVTTRDEGIARKNSTIRPYKIKALTDDMCWSIIKQKSAFESRGGKEHAEKIGNAIAMKCGGVALAAKSIGQTLQYINFSEWESLRDSNIWTLCFAYCAIFPKGHKIVKDELIHQWVSLGFSTWQLGERCISQLLGLSFLEHSNSQSNIDLYGEDITLLTMHDLVHDLARTAMDNEILVVSKGDNARGSCYHYALLDDCSKPLVLELSKIRALRFMKCDKSKVHDVAFSSANSLRVLDLSECIIHKLPDSIGVLKQLRYLAPGVQHPTIPDIITKLSKLIYLDIHGSPTIVELPKSIGDIEGLVYLHLSGCSGLAKLSESFRRLQKLVHLDLSNCSCVGGILVLLGNLTQLQYLNLSHCQKIGEMPEALGVLSKLEYLNLSFSSYLESCQEAEVLGSLNKLEYLNLSSKHCSLQKLPEVLGTFIQLKYLNLSGCQSMSELPRSFMSLKNLVYLDLSDCCTIDCLDEALVGLSNLQHLNLQGTCIKLLPEDVNKLRISKAPQLGGSAISLPHFGVQPGDGHSSSNLVLLEHMDPIVLKLTELENVKSVEEAHRINLMGKKKLEDLTLEWTRDAERFVDHKILMENLVPPSTLKKLELCGYSGVSFPAWLVGQLPNLERLILRGMENLEEWNTSYSNGEDHVIGQLEIHDCPMLRMKPLPPKATYWVISNSDNVLSSWEVCTGPHTNATCSFSAVATVLSMACAPSTTGSAHRCRRPSLGYSTQFDCVGLGGTPSTATPAAHQCRRTDSAI